jgi:hypothetical protein
MTGTIEITGTGGILEGNLEAANVNVNLDPVYGHWDGDNDAVYFNTTDNDLDSIWAGNGGCVAAWIYPKSMGESSYARIFDKNQWLFNLRDYDSGTNTARLNFSHNFSNAGADWYTTNRVVNFDGWNHVAVFYDSDVEANDPVIYINGVSVGTVSSGLTENNTPDGTINSDAGSSLYIGNNSSGTRTFDGYIMDAKVYKNVAVTATNVAKMASKINVDKDAPDMPTSGLQAWWKFNASTTADSSGNSNNLTVATALSSPVYDAFSVDVYDNSTTTDGTFTVTQGKVEGLSLTSLDFDGTNDHVVISSESFADGLNEAAVCFWFQPDASSAAAYMFSCPDVSSGNNGFDVFVQSGKVKGGVRSSGTSYTLVTGINDVTLNQWNHAALVVDGSAINLYLDGVLEATAAFDTSSAVIEADAGVTHIGNFGSFDGAYFNGALRDVKFFDHSLSAEQVASLYSNTNPITPAHYHKLDEGSGTTAQDTGTSTERDGTLTNSPTYVNGTLDLNSPTTDQLRISANGTLSAPRGNLAIGGAISATLNSFENYGTFIHNNGTVTFDATADYGQRIQETASAATAFYNLTHNRSASSYHLYIKGDITVENILLNQVGFVNLYGPNTLTMGTTSSAGAMTMTSSGIRFYNNDSSNYAKIYGASNLYPFVYTGTEPDIDTYSTNASHVAFKNGDIQVNMTSDYQGGIVRLDGDMEFDAVTVNSGDTLNLNGQRMTTSGQLSGSGTFTGTNGLLSVADLRCDGFSSFDLQNTDIMFNASCSPRMNGSPSNKARTMFVQAGDVVGMARATTTVNNVIAAGDLRQGNNDQDMALVDLTIPVGGNLNTQTRTGISYTCSGDFTTSGGLLGASCLSLDRDNTEYAQIPYHSDLNFFASRNAMTAECWFKTSYTGSNHQHLINLKDVDGNPQVMQVYIDYSTGKINARIFTSGITSTQIGASDVRDGKWHHVAIVYDGGTGEHSLYIDGKLEATETGSGAVYPATDAEFNIGIRYSLDQGYFEGEIDEVRLFAAAKTATQIRADMFKDVGTSLTHFNSAADGSTDGLVGRWGANEGTGSALSCSNSNLNGVIYDYNGGSPAAYSDAWAGAGTFTPGTSTIKMTGSSKNINYTGDETIGHLHVDAGQTTLNNISVSDGTDTFSCASITIDSGTTFTTTSGTTTLTGKTSSGNYSLDNQGTFTNNSGTIKVTGDGGHIREQGTGGINNLIVELGGSSENHRLSDSTTVGGTLTIVEGDFQPNGRNLTVTGDVSIESGGTITGSSGAMSFGSLTIASGATYSATSGTTTMTSKNSSNYIMDLDGTFTHNNGTVRINSTGSGDQLVDLIPSSGTLYNLEINENSSNPVQYNGNTTIANNLTIVEGIFQFFDNNNSNLTVSGDVDIESGGQLGAAGWAGAGEFGGIRINSGGTYQATSGTTTVTNRFTGTSNLWKNDGGTFNHNNGTVKFTDNDHSLVKELTFYNLEQASSLGDYALSWETQSGTACTILGNLTITRGDFEIHAAGNTLDIHGQTILNGSSDTGARFNNDKNQTGTITHHGIVTINGGTYHVEDGATVNMAGIRNLGGVVD